MSHKCNSLVSNIIVQILRAVMKTCCGSFDVFLTVLFHWSSVFCNFSVYSIVSHQFLQHFQVMFTFNLRAFHCNVESALLLNFCVEECKKADVCVRERWQVVVELGRENVAKLAKDWDYLRNRKINYFRLKQIFKN